MSDVWWEGHRLQDIDFFRVPTIERTASTKVWSIERLEAFVSNMVFAEEFGKHVTKGWWGIRI